jgi:hypothetical protein
MCLYVALQLRIQKEADLCFCEKLTNYVPSSSISNRGQKLLWRAKSLKTSLHWSTQNRKYGNGLTNATGKESNASREHLDSSNADHRRYPGL